MVHKTEDAKKHGASIQQQRLFYLCRRAKNTDKHLIFSVPQTTDNLEITKRGQNNELATPVGDERSYRPLHYAKVSSNLLESREVEEAGMPRTCRRRCVIEACTHPAKKSLFLHARQKTASVASRPRSCRITSTLFAKHGCSHCQGVRLSQICRALTSSVVVGAEDTERLAFSHAVRRRRMARGLDLSLLARPAPLTFSNSATAQSTSLLSKSSPPRWVSPPVALTY